ncbi:MAG: SocA family protein [Nitrosomonadales bacterium]|nr:SocA family protein [Nitrosomonadales bacterium]
MPVHVKHFDRDKALEAILFIAKSLNNPTFHSISKMLYLSDKLHLQDYGRLICGDRYIAMDNGPVPSAIYDMMKVAAGRRSIDVDWDEIIREAMAVRHGREIVAKRESNLDLLSESEIECIQKTIAVFGNKSFGELTDITHDSAWDATDDNQTIPLASIVATLPNAAEVAGYLHVH